MASEETLAGDLEPVRSSNLQTSPTDDADLSFLRPALDAAGYNEVAVRALIELREIGLLTDMALPGASWRCQRHDTPAARLTRLFFLGEGVPAKALATVFTAEQLKRLQARQILRLQDGHWYAGVAIYPCQSAYVLTDLKFRRSIKNPVYDLGTDSYALARLAYRRPVHAALDLCTGSGIHAVLAASHSQESVGIDINPRAVTFARLNAAINGCHCQILEGNLYEPVRDRTFDLIVSNPPFVAAPSVDMDLHRWGGEDGEDLIRTIVSGLRTHLRPGGTLSMVSDYPIKSTSTYLERLAEWLGGSTGWGLAVFKMFEYTLEQFITPHLPFERLPNYASYRSEFRRWMDLYERLHIDRMGYTMTYIRRLQPTRPGYSAERTGLQPLETEASFVGPWLDALDKYHDPAWTVAWDTWRPCCSGLVWTSQTGQVKVDSQELDGDLAWIASHSDGQRTAADLATAWSTHHSSSDASSRERLVSLFRHLGQRAIII